MSWSSANTSCNGSFTFFAPIPLNLLITADVLSCVMQRCGRIERKSPARSGRFGPSDMCVCAIFSVMVWPILNSPRRRRTRRLYSTLSLELESQVDHLPDVVIQMRRALQNHVEPVGRIRTYRSVWLRPVFRRLTANCPQHDVNRIIELLQCFCLGRACGLGKFPRAVPDVSRLRDLRSDVIVQIACEMQDQVAKTVSEWERLSPELFIAERPRQLANPAGKLFVAGLETRGHRVLKIRHFLFLLLCFVTLSDVSCLLPSVSASSLYRASLSSLHQPSSWPSASIPNRYSPGSRWHPPAFSV